MGRLIPDLYALFPDYSTLRNGAIGGVLSVFLIFVPFVPLVAGTVSGYLEGREDGSPEGSGEKRSITRTGLQVGVICGSIPFVLLGFFWIRLVLLAWQDRDVLWSQFLVELLGGGLVIGWYTIGLGAAGGVLGVYLVRKRAS